MNRIALILLLGLAPVIVKAQNPEGNYNPFVDGGTISPAPLSPTEIGGKGFIIFNIGNKGSDVLEVYPDHQMILTLTLSYGIPDNEDPLMAIGGSFASYFSWTYDSEFRTYSAVQTNDIPANSNGNIEIAFQVSINSSYPGVNGFNVNITPSPYQTLSNVQADDAVSAYTFTEEETNIRLNEDSRISIFPNPSAGEFTVDPKGLNGRFHLEVIAMDGRIVKNDMIDLKGTPVNIVIENNITGLYHIHLSNDKESFKGELIIE